jgi:putative transcriptional regulator
VIKKQYNSGIAASIHETAQGLHEIGLMDKRTMKEFDELCLTPISPLTPDEIRSIREHENVSQVVFSNYLNVTKGIISQWERGEKKPSGSSLKLLFLVKKKGLDAIA